MGTASPARSHRGKLRAVNIQSLGRFLGAHPACLSPTPTPTSAHTPPPPPGPGLALPGPEGGGREAFIHAKPAPALQPISAASRPGERGGDPHFRGPLLGAGMGLATARATCGRARGLHDPRGRSREGRIDAGGLQPGPLACSLGVSGGGGELTRARRRGGRGTLTLFSARSPRGHPSWTNPNPRRAEINDSWLPRRLGGRPGAERGAAVGPPKVGVAEVLPSSSGEPALRPGPRRLTAGEGGLAGAGSGNPAPGRQRALGGQRQSWRRPLGRERFAPTGPGAWGPRWRGWERASGMSDARAGRKGRDRVPGRGRPRCYGGDAPAARAAGLGGRGGGVPAGSERCPGDSGRARSMQSRSPGPRFAARPPAAAATDRRPARLSQPPGNRNRL